MTRPKKQVVDYFPHSCIHKRTMFILEERYGNNGYAFWFKLLEMLGASEGHFVDLNDESIYEFLQAKTRSSNGFCDEILNLLAKLDAIDKELWQNKVIWCQNFVDNISDVYRNRRVEIPVKPDNYSDKPQPDSVSTVNNPQSKVKESKVKESKVNKIVYGEFSNILLSDEEYKKLVDRFGQKETSDIIEELSIAIKSKGYKYKDHYATILNWKRRKETQSGTHKQGDKDDPDKFIKGKYGSVVQR